MLNKSKKVVLYSYNRHYHNFVAVEVIHQIRPKLFELLPQIDTHVHISYDVPICTYKGWLLVVAKQLLKKSIRYLL